MPNNTFIVNQINETLQGSILADMQPAQFYGLGTMNATKDTSVKRAGIVTTSGEIQRVNPDDRFVLQVYHRNLGNSYGDAENTFGDVIGRAKVADNQLFIYAKGEHLNLTADELLTMFEVAMPQAMESDYLFSCDVVVTSSIMEKGTLVKQEFGKEDFLKPEHYFFALRYRVQYSYDPACLEEYLQSKKAHNGLLQHS